jgi:hypothetical protein
MNELERVSAAELLQHPYFTAVPDLPLIPKVTMPLLVVPVRAMTTLADVETCYTSITCKKTI